MNTFKKVLRWTPIVTIVLVAVMAIGTVCGSDYSWSSDKGSIVKAVSSQFGHSGWDHWFKNASWFFVFGVAAELVFKKKRWYIAALSVAMIPQILSNYFGWAHDGMGASGWIASILGILSVSVCFAGARNLSEMEPEGNMGVAFAILMPSLLNVLAMSEQVRKASAPRANTDLTHYVMHVVGHVTGLAMAFVALMGWIIALVVYYRRNK